MRRIGRYVLVLALVVGALVGPLMAPATLALADDSATLKARLDEARATRDGLYAEAGQVSEQLNQTRYQLEVTQQGIDETNSKIDSTKADIQVKEQELAERRGELADQVSDDYKSGGLRLLDIILSSRSIEEFVSHVYYADKVAEQRAETIHETVTLQNQLEEQKGQLEAEEQALETQKSEQQELATQQEAQQADLQVKAQAADDYVAGLDQELKDALAAEEAARKAEAERAAREAAAQLAAQQAQELQQQQQQSQQAPAPSAPSGGGSSSGGNSSGGGNSSSGGSSSPSVDYGSGSLTQSQRNIIVNAALSMVGGNYVYGAYDPAGRTFDCSGLTSYCYAQAGISIPHSSYAQRSMCSIKPISALQPGDLVFWSGHVAIYYGGGMIIEASDPSTGIVGPRAIWGSPIGGGTP